MSQDWNISTGGNSLRNGSSNQNGPIDETLLWSGGLPSTFTRGPVSDSIYLATVRINNITNFLQGSKIVMIDIRNGDTLWTTNLPIDFPATDWFNRISAIKNGVLYAARSGNSNQSYLYALNVADGSIIWKSESLIDESSNEGLNFLDNGDLIVGNINSIIRINKSDGNTIWQTDRLGYQDGAELAVYGSKIYGISNDLSQLKIAAFDSGTGQLLYKSSSIDNGFVQQQSLFIGNDGKIYLPRSQNNPLTDSLYSFTDNGTGFTKNWSVPIHYIPFSSSGTSNDGYVYSYGRTGRVIRIDATSGELIDSSMIILGDANNPRMCIDAAGIVNVTNGGFSDGAFFSFNADLSLRWQTSVPNIYVGGPIIGWEGTLVISGTGTDFRAYRGDNTATIQDNSFIKSSEIFNVHPNPFQNQVVLSTDPSLAGSTYIVCDYMGKVILTGKVTSSTTMIDLTFLSSGVYLLGLGDDFNQFVKIIKE